jgi:hypothetical protein
LNYSDTWGKKTEVSGSYFFNNSSTNNDQLSNAQYFLPNGQNQFYNENNISGSTNYNHRLNLRIEYKIDAKNSISIVPTFSFQKNTSLTDITGVNSFATGNTISKSLNSSNSKSSGYNFNNNILFRHAFNKKGRTLSINLTTGLNKKDGETYITISISARELI